VPHALGDYSYFLTLERSRLPCSFADAATTIAYFAQKLRGLKCVSCGVLGMKVARGLKK
jgi:hypothetical protein